ncbi:MAG TPA: hypothetical protein VKX17_12475 [Planctomycetota bacterium]|nr:hypothetical protein [Planctomycetota bacterium]
MTGSVNSKLEATLPLTVHGPAREQVVTAVIDTGYDGLLSAPKLKSRIHELDLPLKLVRKRL